MPKEVVVLHVELPDERERLQKWLQDYNDARNFRRAFEARWRRVRRLYRLRPNRKLAFTADEAFVPWLKVVVDDMAARVLNAIYSVAPIVTAVGRHGVADEALANQVARWLDFLFSDKDFNFVRAISACVRDTFLYGVGFLGLRGVLFPWRGEVIRKPSLVWVPLREMYVDPWATSIDDARYIIRRVVLHRDDVMARAEAQGWVLPSLQSGGAWMADEPLTFWEDIGMGAWTPFQGDRWEVLEFWYPDRYVAVLERAHVIAERELAGRIAWPYVDARMPCLAGLFYSMGLGEVLEKLQEELNTVRTQRSVLRDHLIRPVYIAVPGMITNIQVPQELAWGRILYATSPTAIQPLPRREIPQWAYLEESQVVRDIQLASGLMDYALGIPPQRSRERATTVIRLQEAAMNRFSEFMRDFSAYTLRAMIQKLLAWTVAYIPRDFYQRVIGETDLGLYQSSVEEVVQAVDVNPMVAQDVQRRNLNAERLAQVLPILLQMPGVNIRLLLRYLLNLYGIPDADAIVQNVPVVLAPQAGGQTSGSPT